MAYLRPARSLLLFLALAFLFIRLTTVHYLQKTAETHLSLRPISVSITDKPNQGPRLSDALYTQPSESSPPPPSTSVTSEPTLGEDLRLSHVLYTQPSEQPAAHLWRTPSEAGFRKLLSCLETRSCTTNQEKIIIIESMYFRNALRGDVGGEEIWARSTLAAMANLGYTVLQVESLREAAEVYRIMPERVNIVLVDDWQSFLCWKDKKGCLRAEQNPDGIPGFKLLSFYFWPFPRHPLGSRWILSPEPYALQTASETQSNNTYLGYSIEESCLGTNFVPANARPNQAWLLAKLLSYFAIGKNPNRAWSKWDLDSVAEQTGIQVVLGAGLSEDDEKELESEFPDQNQHFVNHGRLQQALFMEKLAESKMVIGMGRPLISPTPWNALCLGVPWINPIHSWDINNPDDPSGWRSQHPFAALLPKPYVYNVRKGDKEGLINAIQSALGNPIQPYIPERMRMESIQTRLAEIVDTDWEAEERKQAEWCKGPCGCQKPCDAHTFGDIY
ncbi:hypothetical protein B0H11DRAFT_1864853 [Mycena galericulata]|nr:hypothetical protein B0H11DRAFT_1864853 [Mycena galericulata]